MSLSPAACDVTTPADRPRSRSLLGVGLTLALWLVAVGLAYLSMPLSGLSWWFGLLFGLFVLFAFVAFPVASLGLAIHCLVQRAWLRAATVVLIATCSAFVIAHVNWQQAFVGHQVALHHDDLDELAAAYSRGEVTDRDSLPWSLRLLSSDDVAHVWSVDDPESPMLFIQTWQDWRAESGVGLAYFPSPPKEPTMVRTAEGDGGTPVRDLGGGWWWIE